MNKFKVAGTMAGVEFKQLIEDIVEETMMNCFSNGDKEVLNTSQFYDEALELQKSSKETGVNMDAKKIISLLLSGVVYQIIDFHVADYLTKNEMESGGADRGDITEAFLNTILGEMACSTLKAKVIAQQVANGDANIIDDVSSKIKEMLRDINGEVPEQNLN